MKFITEIAIKKSGIDGWLPCIWEMLDDQISKVSGGVPIGKRKDGRPKWGPKKSLTVVYVLETEIDAARLAYESLTRNCSFCEGSGKEIWSWSIDGTNKYRDCRKCKGTGKPLNGNAP